MTSAVRDFLDLSIGGYLVLAILTPILFCVALGVYNYYFHPIAHLPGPFFAKISPFSQIKMLAGLKYSPSMQKLHEEYGPVVRVGPNELSFATHTSHSTIYNSPPGPKGEHFSKDGTFIDTLTNNLMFNTSTLITVSDLHKHKRLRKQLNAAFTTKAMQDQEPIHNHHMNKVLADLDQAAITGADVNITVTLHNMLWDLIGDLSFGEPLSHKKRDYINGVIQSYFTLAPYVEMLNYLLASIPGVIAFSQVVVPWIPNPIHMQHFLPHHTLKEIQLRREGRKRQDGRVDFLSAILDEKNPDFNLSKDEILENTIVLLLAGLDTTYMAVNICLYQILHHPENFEKLQHEVRSTFTSLEEVTGEKVARLPFLSAIINESLRLLPPVGGKISLRNSPGAEVDGIYVPKGVAVTTDLYSIHRSPAYWADAASFRPERWIDNGPGTKYENDLRSALKPFGTGTRQCIGRHMAMKSVRLMLTKLAFRYDVKLIEKEFVWERDAKSSLFWGGFDMHVKVTKTGGQ